MLKIKQLILSLILLLSTMSLSSVSMAKDIFTQQGKASWYGGKHHGKKTASGVAYNMHSDTIAHKSLPFGTKVEITGGIVTGPMEKTPQVQKMVDVYSRIVRDEFGGK